MVKKKFKQQKRLLSTALESTNSALNDVFRFRDGFAVIVMHEAGL